MVGYANDRKQFNAKIGDFQMVQQMLADSVIAKSVMRKGAALFDVNR
jgi:acyl-CoA dehydrogenase